MFVYTLKCYPTILNILNQALSPTTKFNLMEQFLTFLFAVTEFSITDEAMEIFLDLLTSYNLSFKEQVISKTYAIIKKIAAEKTENGPFDSFEASNDILTQISFVFHVQDNKERNFKTVDLIYHVLTWLCKD